jgi:hypothetical protein
MYENSGVQVVYAPNKNEYKLIRVDAPKSVLMAHFKNKDKKALEFVGDCKSALELISTSQLNNDIENATKLCDALASCK